MISSPAQSIIEKTERVAPSRAETPLASTSKLHTSGSSPILRHIGMRRLPLLHSCFLAIVIAAVASFSISSDAHAQRLCDVASTQSGEPTDPEGNVHAMGSTNGESSKRIQPPATNPPIAPSAVQAPRGAGDSTAALSWFDSFVEALRRLKHFIAKGPGS
jgi:hypothetical protein